MRRLFIVRFAYIVGIVDHHCLKILFLDHSSDSTPNFYGSATLIRYQLLLINVNYYDMYDKYITVLSMYNGYHLENRYDINDKTE
jgi:hypothetical protein